MDDPSVENALEKKAGPEVEIHSGSCFTAFTRRLPEYAVSWFVLTRERRTYLIDTGCGPDDMAGAAGVIRAAGRPLVVVNTHFHWDHVWGNCAFPEAEIVSTFRCRERMRKEWASQWIENGRLAVGQVEMRLPGVCFDARMAFEDDGLLLFRSPGHTDDSLTVWDSRNRLLIAGDNLERPIPYVEDPDLAAYRATLAGYRAFGAETILAAHSWPLAEADIRFTEQYLEDLAADRPRSFGHPTVQALHGRNRACSQSVQNPL